MFDPLSLVTGAALLGSGWILGRYGRTPSRKSAPQPTALCGCGHDLSLHDREAGACHAEIFRKTGAGLKAWVPCNCRRYTGPTPLEEFFAPTPLPPTD
ncbi:hypothetical protein LTV02_20475 [Nocardia yamanashiensis]|uniref:hypothetical protein n=1 Tax=Nocardia yamanashiensis TaxID=209247 RepID=UPI001E5777C6|nr:hypothetical protein [Nocardia yamanashiensis]UGT38531.1 hypothetical protein LTV02_20475 [Nocardia yamanashiensis]